MKKRLTLRKTVLVELGSSQMRNIFGGEGECPTYGDRCTVGNCEDGSVLSPGCGKYTEDGCTGNCYSNPDGADCSPTIGGDGCLPLSEMGFCFSDRNCSAGGCTGLCPPTVNDNGCPGESDCCPTIA